MAVQLFQIFLHQRDAEHPEEPNVASPGIPYGGPSEDREALQQQADLLNNTTRDDIYVVGPARKSSRH